MKCPTCPDATLVMTDRQGVEIHHCPTCRSVLLGRGKLDQLLELAASVAAPEASTPKPTLRRRSHPDYRAAIVDILKNFNPQTADPTLATGWQARPTQPQEAVAERDF